MQLKECCSCIGGACLLFLYWLSTSLIPTANDQEVVWLSCYLLNLLKGDWRDSIHKQANELGHQILLSWLILDIDLHFSHLNQTSCLTSEYSQAYRTTFCTYSFKIKESDYVLDHLGALLVDFSLQPHSFKWRHFTSTKSIYANKCREALPPRASLSFFWLMIESC